MTRPLIFLGSSENILGFADLCWDQDIPIAGIIDKDYYLNTTDIDGIPYIGAEDTADFVDLSREHDFFVSITSIPDYDRNVSKRQLYIDIVNEFDLPCRNLIDRDARISRTVKLGKGVYVGNWTMIQNHVIIGDHCQIYGHAGIGHHSVLEQNVVIQRSCAVCAHCHVGENSYIALGARLLRAPAMTVGKNCFVHPGVTVMRNIKDSEIVSLTGRSGRRVYNSIIL